MTQTDAQLRDILTNAKTIALVGASSNPARPSFQVGNFLAGQGYRVIGVNPGLAGQQLYGETVVGALGDITDPVDIVDIFRAGEAVPAIVEEALSLSGPRTIWMQLGVHSAEGAALAREDGLEVVENRCPKIEIPRLGLL
ncbi:CoA-binding protein [Donghicola sp. C2-DW-16]|uniref:CoA-binding protein n=1 Tax=Donghicola mangrovi TaxID=2729614 RepID=A0ABX2PK47_9RHOB|nr:CoA-binding protein [Donghicola mangrovi]NVO29087.1 CoA-binding protein [Donghicola mangrovi]